jgi:hypothetical protein
MKRGRLIIVVVWICAHVVTAASAGASSRWWAGDFKALRKKIPLARYLLPRVKDYNFRQEARTLKSTRWFRRKCKKLGVDAKEIKTEDLIDVFAAAGKKNHSVYKQACRSDRRDFVAGVANQALDSVTALFAPPAFAVTVILSGAKEIYEYNVKRHVLREMFQRRKYFTFASFVGYEAVTAVVPLLDIFDWCFKFYKWWAEGIIREDAGRAYLDHLQQNLERPPP